MTLLSPEESLDRLVDMKPRKSDWADYVVGAGFMIVGGAGVASVIFNPGNVREVYDVLFASAKVPLTAFGVSGVLGLKSIIDGIMQARSSDTDSNKQVYYDNGYLLRHWKYSWIGKLVHPIQNAGELTVPGRRKQLVFVNGVSLEDYRPVEVNLKGRELSTVRGKYQTVLIAGATSTQSLRDKLDEDLSDKPKGHSLYILGEYIRGERVDEREGLKKRGIGVEHGSMLKILDFGPAFTN